MPYIVTGQPKRTHQITLEDVLSFDADGFKEYAYDPTATTTRFFERIPEKYRRGFGAEGFIFALESFIAKHDALYKADRKSLYYTFHISKKTGGLRRIDAPQGALMAALRELKELFEKRCGPMYHTTAFAYVPGRCTVDSVRRHQNNESKWFLKTDFSDFFGSTTPEFLASMLRQIFPFREVMASERGEKALTKALDLCFLNGSLPQGTPISP